MIADINKGLYFNKIKPASIQQFFPSNEYGSDKEVASVVGDVDDAKGLDSNVDIDFGTQQFAGRKGASDKRFFQYVQKFVFS